MRKVFICIRHGEAYKNLKDYYGGNGSSLTQKGVNQILESTREIAKIINSYPNYNVNIFRSCERIQVIQTSDIIAKILGINVYSHDLFKPIKLGVFDGLSAEEREKKYTQEDKALKLWNKGLGDINDVVVEGMQSASSHYNQLNKFLSELPNNSINILVGTRSDLSALKNCFLGNNPEEYMQYKCYNINCGEFFVYDFGKNDEIIYKDVEDINERN